MKTGVVLLVAAGVLALAGCGDADVTGKEQDGVGRETGMAPEIEAEAVKAPETERVSEAETETERVPGTKTKTESEEEQYTWQEMTITLPRDWVGRCVVEESEAGFTIYQKASYEKDDTQGYICGFFRTKEEAEYGIGKTLIAYTEDGMLYYLAQPMDVACDSEDEKIVGEYVGMCQQVPQVRWSLQISGSGVHDNAEEYLISTSSLFKLDPVILREMSDYSLWIARNEIYARHGRQFDNVYLQEYFNRCTWYEGEIPAQEFQESVLNQTERENVQLLKAAEEEYDRRHPYPERHGAQEIVREDLNGDGTVDEIGYRVREAGTGEYLCEITVNGEVYPVNELSAPGPERVMMNPMADCFYITDILENDGLLEIAVPDEGPSEDPVTYFYQYDGSLSCIGWVSGFPFLEMNQGPDGFDGAGTIAGCLRTDLIETAYLQGRWRYDGEEIRHPDYEWYDYLPAPGHVLYENLPVYAGPDETSAAAVIKAQEQVFFLGTDREQWILVKGKDGSQGYLLVEDGKVAAFDKPAGEVFSGLRFFD